MTNFTQDQLKEIKECFELIDTDNSGAIDKPEIKNLLRTLEITTTDEDFEEVFDSIDTNKSGSIEWEEFIEFIGKNYEKKFTQKQQQACFKRFDLNGDNIVTINELRIVLEKLGKTMTQKQLEDMVKAVDKDRSGNLSLDEFEKLLP